MPLPVDSARARLQRLLGLDSLAAERAVNEVLDCFSLDVEEYIVQRHRELRAAGTSNEAAYELIARELPQQRFAASDLTIRQIRRRIYG